MAPFRELDDGLAPLRSPVEVGKTVADHQSGAARISAREWIVGFAAEGHCHRLVEQRDALFDPPLPHHGPTDLRQRHALDIGIRELVRYRERSARMLLCCDRIRRLVLRLRS